MMLLHYKKLINIGKKFKVSGYNTYTTPREITNRGLAILVKSRESLIQSLVEIMLKLWQ